MTQDKTFINGKIFTSNEQQSYATAMTVSHGKISWIGDAADVDTADKNIVDLKGQTIIPGIIDAHMHPLFLADAQEQIACTAPYISSIEELIEKVQEASEDATPESWIRSWGYDEGKLTEGRAPNRHDLDQATTEFPVVVTRTCGHIISVNSKALTLAGITKDTPDPAGGRIDRDENGEPTGILMENARELVLSVQPTPTMDELTTQISNLSDHLFSHGITGITEMLGEHEPTDYYQIYEESIAKGFKHRTGIYYAWDAFKKLSLDKDMLDENKQVFIKGIKLFADGSVSGRTAWVEEPYVGDADNVGISTTTKEEILAAADAAEKHQLQLAIHAMGERAIAQIIDTLAEKENWLAEGPSIRIEHAAFPTEESITRAAERNITFVPQPVFLFAEIESYVNNVGQERTASAYPIRTMLEKGINVALSSDAPATSWADPADPFVGLKSAVTRVAYNGADTGQDQRIDIETAVRLYTKDAQQSTQIPNVGQLRVGYHADFVVLNEDIFTIDSEKIDQVHVEQTFLNGECVYQR